MLIAHDVSDPIRKTLQLPPQIDSGRPLDAPDMDVDVAAGSLPEAPPADRGLDAFAERCRQNHLPGMENRERRAPSEHHPARRRRNDSAALESEQMRGRVDLRGDRELLDRNRVGGNRRRKHSNRGRVRRQRGGMSLCRRGSRPAASVAAKAYCRQKRTKEPSKRAKRAPEYLSHGPRNRTPRSIERPPKTARVHRIARKAQQPAPRAARS